MGKISMPQGKGSQMHNLRAYPKKKLIDENGREIEIQQLPEHIHQARMKENKVIKHIPLSEAYEQIFGDEVKRYNSTQKRKDRRIDSYMDKIRGSKNGEKLFYEDIVQWGTKDDFEGLFGDMQRRSAKKALEAYAKSFEARNPNLRLIGAYLHMDEASPHLHIDYIPVADGYKKGMRIRNSLDRAFRQQGIEPREGKDWDGNKKLYTRTEVWKERERAYFGELCREQSLAVDAEEKGRGHNMTVPEYKQMMDDVHELEERADQLKDEISNLGAQKTEKRQALELAEYDASQHADEIAYKEPGRLAPLYMPEKPEIKRILGREYIRADDADKLFSGLESALRAEREHHEKDRSHLADILKKIAYMQAEVAHVKASPLYADGEALKKAAHKVSQLERQHDKDQRLISSQKAQISEQKAENEALRNDFDFVQRSFARFRASVSQAFQRIRDKLKPKKRKAVLDRAEDVIMSMAADQRVTAADLHDDEINSGVQKAIEAERAQNQQRSRSSYDEWER